MLTTNEQTELDILLEMDNPSDAEIKRIKYLQEKYLNTDIHVKEKINCFVKTLSPSFKQILQNTWTFNLNIVKNIKYSNPKVQELFDTYIDQLPDDFKFVSDTLFTDFYEYITKQAIAENTELIEKFKNSVEVNILFYRCVASFQKSVIEHTLHTPNIMGLPVFIKFSYIYECFSVLDDCTEFEPSYELLCYIVTNLIDYAKSTFELPSALTALIQEGTDVVD